MMWLTELVTVSPATADGFTVSVVLLVSAIIALFVAMRNHLKKK
jgi:hypothetical protein